MVPGFSKGKLSLPPTSRKWQVDGQCINGDPRRNYTAQLTAPITYYGGGEVPNPSNASLYMPDGVTIDPNFIFPWDPTATDPLRLGGGIVLGGVQEGAQRQDPRPGDPILGPFIASDWVNGTPTRINVEIPTALGVTFYPGDRAFALAILDRATGRWVARAVAKSEGNCLDVPVA